MSLVRILLVWLLLAVLMSGNGIFREAVLLPQVGRAAADLISALLGIGIIMGTTGFFFRRRVLGARIPDEPAAWSGSRGGQRMRFPSMSQTSTSPRFLPRIASSMRDRSPAITTSARSGVKCRRAAAWMSDGVSAVSRSR